MENKDIIQDKLINNKKAKKINNKNIEKDNSKKLLNNKREREEKSINNDYNIDNKNNENITSGLEKDIKISNKCNKCGKGQLKQINNINELFTFLNEKIFKFPIDVDVIKQIYLNISINNLCEECLSKEIIFGGINNLLKKINHNNDDNFNFLSQNFINSFMKRLNNINESMIKNIIETEEVMNKMSFNLTSNKNKTQFLQFNEDMNNCKNHLKNTKKSYSNLYNSLCKENNILRKTLNINDPQNDIKNEQYQNLIDQMKEINNEIIYYENINNNIHNYNINNNNIIENPLNINDILHNEIKSQFLIPENNNDNKKQTDLQNNINLNYCQFMKDMNNINNHFITNNLFLPFVNNNNLLEFPTNNFYTNNIYPTLDKPLNNPLLNTFKVNSNFSDNNSQMFNQPLNNFNQFINTNNLFFPIPIIQQNNIQNTFNQKIVGNNPQETNNLFYGNDDLAQNFYDGKNNQNDAKIYKNNTGNLKNMFNILAREKEEKNVNNSQNNSLGNNQENQKNENQKN